MKTRIFEGLATEAVEECAFSLINASKVLEQKVFGAFSYLMVQSPLDARLFLIKHLLILREQITPFEISFSFTQSELDFSHMKGKATMSDVTNKKL